MVIEIKELIERNKLLELCEYLQELNSVDVANQLMDLEDEELVQMLLKR